MKSVQMLTSAMKEKVCADFIPTDYILRESYTTQNVVWLRASVCVSLSVCVSVRGRTPTLLHGPCLLYTSPSPRDRQKSRMPSSA